MLTDLVLAVAHHLLIFSIAAILAAELVLVRPEMIAADVRRIGRIDLFFGVAAGVVLIVGFARVFFGLKGAEFYLANPVFWLKMAAFAAVGVLSIQPTIAILRWNRKAIANPGFIPPLAEIEKARQFMRLEAGVFLLIPVFAAAMARGYGI